MIEAIVYMSNAGHTKRYAEMLTEKLGIPAYSYKDAKKKLKRKSTVIYMTWVRAGKLVGLKKARRRYSIKVICAVGMNMPSKTLISNLQNANKINMLKEKLFYMQGGFDMDKLKGINQMLMMAIQRSLTKVSETRKLSLEQKEMLNMINNKKDNVKVNNIKELYSWYNKEIKQ